MKTLSESVWVLADMPTPEEVRQRLDTLFYQVSVEQATQQTRTLLDDFDWHLTTKQETLFWVGSHSSPQSGGLLLVTPKREWQLNSLDGPPVFWWDLPESALADHLSKRIGVRALLPRVHLDESQTLLACRDDEGKVRARVELTQQVIRRADHEETPHYFRHLIRLQPLRGYAADARTVYACLSGWLDGLQPAESTQDVLAVCGFQPHQECLPNPLPLEAEASVETNLRQTAALLFSQVRRYEPGIMADTDTEFLHQYRVNLRRLRSIFSLLKKVLPSEMQQKVKAHLADLARPTNQLRDLDVFLLQRSTFRDWLPETFHAGLDRLFRNISKERARQHRLVASSLLGRKYQQQAQWLEDFFSAAPLHETSLSVKPLGPVADLKLWKAYSRIVAEATHIDASTPDEQVHELRIDCKKLRYLLDFFADLYPKKQIQRQVSALKQLQNILGDFNDFSVQQTFLAQWAHEEAAQSQVAAVHGLTAVLHQKQKEARAQVVEALQTFIQAEVYADFKQSYGGKATSTPPA